MAGITTMQVTVDALIPERAAALCTEASTGKQIEVRLLPMRVARLPQPGERWLLDRTFQAWTFAALVTSPTAFVEGTGGGAPGLSAYQIAVSNGFVGSEADWLASLEGADGSDGADSTVPGPPGPANTLGIGTVTGGTVADASITGAAPNQTLNLVLPKGDPGTDGTDGTNGTNGVDGSDGLSAYQIAVNNGFVGTEAAWLASLHGTDGTDGTDGLSAYEVAVANGFSGTEAEWLDSLVGPAGSGGSATTPWLKKIDLPLTSLAGWAAGPGSWTVDTGIHQTVVTAATHRLRYTTRVPLATFAVECKIRLDSAASGGNAGLTLRTGPGDVNSGMRIDLRSNGTNVVAVGMETDAQVAQGTYSLDAPIAHGTFITLRIEGSDAAVGVYINDVFLTNVDVPYTNDGPYVGIVGYNAAATWKDLRVWSLGGPTNVATPLGNMLLLESGASVPVGTPVGTVVFQKAAVQTWDFTTGALPSGWVKQGAPTETFDGTGMLASITDNQGYRFDGIGALPDDMTFEVEFVTHSALTQNYMVGPFVLTSANTGFGATWYNEPVGLLCVGSNNLDYSGTFTVVGATPFAPVHQRIRRAGGTNWYAGYSTDGLSWIESPVVSSGLAGANRLFIGMILGSPMTAKIKSARYLPSANTGLAKGWWDGSALQPLA